MKQYIDKADLVAEIEKRIKTLDELFRRRPISWPTLEKLIEENKKVLSFIDTLEAKEVVEEQEGVCNGIFNRIIGDNWNLSIPLDKVGLKHGDKVKIFVTKENKL
jgi:hypothetical protein